jgi:hypothetical protein
MKIKRLVHPPCWLDRSPCDFWLCEPDKTALLDRRFADADTMVEARTTFWEIITFQELQSLSQESIERLK